MIYNTATPLGGSESVSYVGAARSALAELTPLECGGETSESEVEGVLTRRPRQSCCTWVGGWCFTATAVSGPETDSMRVKIW